MSASFYTVGTVYTVGTNPVLKLENVRNTRTFSEFIVRGATAGPLLVGKKVRLRNFPNVAGPQVFPYGYATGQAGLVPVPPVPPADPCDPQFSGDTWPSNAPSACLPAMSVLGDIVAVGHRAFGGTMVGHTNYYWTTLADGALYGLVVVNTTGDPITGIGSVTLTGSYINNTGADITNAVGGFVNLTGGLSVPADSFIRFTLNGRVLQNFVGPLSSYNPPYASLPVIPAGATIGIKLTMDFSITGNLPVAGVAFGIVRT
jgi:hypothetical protein